MKRVISVGILMFAAIGLIGCTKTDSAGKSDQGAKKPADAKTAEDAKAKFLLASEPAGAKSVKEARAKAKDGDAVTVVGRIGGEMKPFGDRATFLIADLSYKACSDIAGDPCETPWDYCCDLPDAKGKVYVKLLDSSGKVISHSAKELLELKELQTVVIKGHVRRGDDDSMYVAAEGIFIRKK